MFRFRHLLLTATIASTTVFASVLPAAALPGPGSLTGDFSGTGSASLLTVDAGNLGALADGLPSVLQLGLGLATTETTLPGSAGETGTSSARALDPLLLDTAIPLTLIDLTQTGPFNDVVRDTLVDLTPLSPLTTGGLVNGEVLAADTAAVTCPTVDAPVVVGSSMVNVTNLGLLDVAGPLVAISDTDGTVDARTFTTVDVDGAVATTSTAQVTTVNLADGALVLEIVNPDLIATATGTPGGASVVYTGEVRLNGDKIVGVQERTISLDILGDFGIDLSLLDPLLIPLDPVVRITAGELQDVVTAANGTSASGSVSVLKLEVLAPVTNTRLLTVDLGHLEASAAAPVGGVGCNPGPNGAPDDDSCDPLAELAIDVSAMQVLPGGTFHYVVTVPNRCDVAITDLTITTTIDGPDGFTITNTDAPGIVDGGTVTWTIDELAPNETAVFIVTVQVPTSATPGSTFDHEVDAVGTFDGEPVTGDAELLDVPEVVSDFGPDASDECDLNGSNLAVTHDEVFPGETYAYLLHVLNTGSVACDEIIVTLELPDDVEYVSCKPQVCSESDGTVTWIIPPGLGSGSSVDLVAVVAAPPAGTGDPDLGATGELVPASGDGSSVATEGPDFTDNSILAAPDPASGNNAPRAPQPAASTSPLPAPSPVASNPAAAPARSLPSTGGGAAIFGLLAALTAASRRRAKD